jgi:hypothetical protein
LRLGEAGGLCFQSQIKNRKSKIPFLGCYSDVTAPV